MYVKGEIKMQESGFFFINCKIKILANQHLIHFFIKFSFDGTSNSSLNGFSHLTSGNVMVRAEGIGHIHV